MFSSETGLTLLRVSAAVNHDLSYHKIDVVGLFFSSCTRPRYGRLVGFPLQCSLLLQVRRSV